MNKLYKYSHFLRRAGLPTSFFNFDNIHELPCKRGRIQMGFTIQAIPLQTDQWGLIVCMDVKSVICEKSITEDDFWSEPKPHFLTWWSSSGIICLIGFVNQLWGMAWNPLWRKFLCFPCFATAFAFGQNLYFRLLHWIKVDLMNIMASFGKFEYHCFKINRQTIYFNKWRKYPKTSTTCGLLVCSWFAKSNIHSFCWEWMYKDSVLMPN